MKIQNNKWFTLVELIVVVTILAILSTIWFVSYSWYLSWVRDTNRVSQLKAIWDSLHLYTTKSSLPLPDDKINITTDWSNIISYQWYAWKNVIEAIWYTSEWKDPQDNTYFSYVVTKDRKYFQLLAYLEEEKGTTQLNSLNLVNAIDYEIRYPHVEWSKLWILLTDTNQPIHEVETTIDLSSAPSWTKSILSNWETQTWSLTSINPLASCKRLYETRWKREDWVYTIDPEWNWTWFKVYCDMNTDWGGWTLIEAYKDAYADEFKKKDWDTDYPISEDNPNFDKYRLSYSNMQSVYNSSIKTHTRCDKDFDNSQNDYLFIDKWILTDTAYNVEVSKWNAKWIIAWINVPKTWLKFRWGLNNSAWWHVSIDWVSWLWAWWSSMEYFTWHDNNRWWNNHHCWDTDWAYIWMLK